MNTPLSPIPLNIYSLNGLQGFNRTVYGAVNGRNFEIHEILGRLAEYNSRVSLRVRKADTARTPYHLCMMLSWLLALANRLEVPLHEEVAQWCKTGLSPNIPLPELQKHFASRHIGAILPNTALCLSEKVQALQVAVGKYRATHEKSHFEDTGRKMAQCIEALCVVAHILEVSLSEEFQTYFGKGCATCHAIPCECGFRADKVM
ncbi:MAG: hypothetical protein Q7R64_02675 [bacterium]|nr:hypothetical protein [bacterium]